MKRSAAEMERDVVESAVVVADPCADENVFYIDFDGTLTAHHTWVQGAFTDAQVEVPQSDEDVIQYFAGAARLDILRRMLNALASTCKVVVLTRSPASEVRVWMKRAGLPDPHDVIGREVVKVQSIGKASIVTELLLKHPTARVGFVDDSSGEVFAVRMMAHFAGVGGRLYTFKAEKGDFPGVPPRDARSVEDEEELRHMPVPAGEGAGLRAQHVDQMLSEWQSFVAS